MLVASMSLAVETLPSCRMLAQLTILSLSDEL